MIKMDLFTQTDWESLKKEFDLPDDTIERLKKYFKDATISIAYEEDKESGTFSVWDIDGEDSYECHILYDNGELVTSMQELYEFLNE